jgi:copper chaperone NosL
MKLFKNLFFVLSLIVLFIGCTSNNAGNNEEKQDKRICPQCNMPLPDSNLHTTDLNDNGDIIYFDDVGCMILWAKDKKIDLKTERTRIFSNDTKRYIEPAIGHFQINEKTPMLYGFSAYEKPCDGCIKFDEVIIKMLRGEHMANPKIRKYILGY